MVRKSIASFTAFVMVGMVLAGCLGGPGETVEDDDEITRVTGRGGTPVVPGAYDMTGDFARVLTAGPYQEHLPLLDAKILSPVDGAEIQIGVWRPKVPDGVKVPVIVDAGPYFNGDMSLNYRGHIMRLGENFIQHGYAVAAVTVRGTANHGGCMDLMGPREQADLDAAITWLGTQDWSNGKVTMTGASYDGSTPFQVASWGNPHLATIIPVVGLTNIYELMYRNGTAETRGPVVLNALYYTMTLTDPNRSPEHRAVGVACPESLEGLAASVYAGAGLGYDPNGWWADRDFRPGLIENYEGSILHIPGLQDWNVDPGLNMPWIDDFARQKGLVLHQWLGQWGHAFPDSSCSANNPTHANCRWDYAEYLLRWLDYWLKDITTIDLGPPVHVQEFDKAWRAEESWPPRDLEWRTFELSMPSEIVEVGQGRTGEIRLQPNPARTTEDYRTVLPMQAHAEFSTGPLEEGMLIAGLPKVHVTVVPEGPGGTVSAWLYRQSAEHGFQRIGWTAMNLHFADGTDTPRPVVPGQPIVAHMEIQPLDVRLQAGDELILRMWTAPPTDRLYNSAPSPVQLLLGNERSVLSLPLVERTDADYFDVPFPKEDAEPDA